LNDSGGRRDEYDYDWYIYFAITELLKMRIYNDETVAGERGAADAELRYPRFALKFYTEDGNWDIVGNDPPVFSQRRWCGASIEAECFKGRLTSRIWSNRL
jgi:hypothetical protein